MQFDIKKKREELGLTLEYVAKFVGVSKSTAHKWESGFIKDMKRDKIIKLSEVLQVSPMELLEYKTCFSDMLKQKKVPLNEEQKRLYQDLILSVFGTSDIGDSAVIFKDNHLILLNSEQSHLPINSHLGSKA